MNNLISVIVPIYNVKEYISDCIESLICQTFRNIEIILINDGSTDKSGKICDEYAKKDNRIKVIHKKNEGLSEARNSGIEIATGNYITFLDGDDFLLPTAIEKLETVMRNNDVDICLCYYLSVNKNGEIQNHVKFKYPYNSFTFTGLEVLEMMGQDNWQFWCPVTRQLYKREVFKQIRFPRGKHHEDSFVAHEIFYTCKKVMVIPKKLYAVRQREDSFMNKKFSVLRLDDMEAVYSRMLFYKKNKLEKYIPGIEMTARQLMGNFIKSGWKPDNEKEKKRLFEITEYYKEIIHESEKHSKAGLSLKVYRWMLIYCPLAYVFLSKVKNFK